MGNLTLKRNTTVSSRGKKNECYNDFDNASKRSCPTCGADLPKYKRLKVSKK